MLNGLYFEILLCYSSNLRLLVSHVGDAPLIIDSTTQGHYVKQLITSSPPTERVYTIGISDENAA